MGQRLTVLELFWPSRRQNAFDEWCPAAGTAAH
jgi:hypothetical protein